MSEGTTEAHPMSAEHSHHRLVEEIATGVEEKLVAKFARWLAVNLFIVLGLLATVIGTYYSLDNRIAETKRIDELSRGGRLGYAYDGVEVDLGYHRIPHYRCCRESVLNPIQAQSMVVFFAQRGGDWFYVELGQLDG